MTLNNKTINGLYWSFLDNLSQYGITFVIGIILARILDPEDFGILGMISVFIAIATTIIDSGFSQSLIRKQNCTNTDYSTTFYFNLAVSVILYILLFLSATSISVFFKEPQLVNIVRIIGFVIIIDAFTIIQRTILTKEIKFKKQTNISIISSVSSGAIAIILATQGAGVWSLVAKQLLYKFVKSILLWKKNKWKPIRIFSYKLFVEHFTFGYKLLLSGLINTIFNNLYYIIIGKYFTPTDLGYYTRADNFQKLPSKNITNVVQRVSYPILASINNNPSQLQKYFQKFLKSTLFLSSLCLIGMVASADNLIIVLIGDKWLPSTYYLQLLSIAGLFYPISAINQNIIILKGRTDLFLKLEILKKILIIPTVVIGILAGIKYMLIGIIINKAIAYFINAHWSGSFIDYKLTDQIKDILPILIFTFSMGAVVFFVGKHITTATFYTFIVQIITGIAYTIIMGEILKFSTYFELKYQILKFITSRRKK